MGNLPHCRVPPPKVPFEHTGVDVFEFVNVKLCRNIVKRWGVFFYMYGKSCLPHRSCS